MPFLGYISASPLSAFFIHEVVVVEVVVEIVVRWPLSSAARFPVFHLASDIFCPRSGHILRLCVLIYKYDRWCLRRLYLVWLIVCGSIDPLSARGEGGLPGPSEKKSGIVLYRLFTWNILLCLFDVLFERYCIVVLLIACRINKRDYLVVFQSVLQESHHFRTLPDLFGVSSLELLPFFRIMTKPGSESRTCPGILYPEIDLQAFPGNPSWPEALYKDPIPVSFFGGCVRTFQVYWHWDLPAISLRTLPI